MQKSPKDIYAVWNICLARKKAYFSSLSLLKQGLFYELHLAFGFFSRLLGWHGKGQAQGVWLKPCRLIHTFTMQQPLTLIWLNQRNEVIKIVSQTKPYRIYGCWQACSVIELAPFTH